MNSNSSYTRRYPMKYSNSINKKISEIYSHSSAKTNIFKDYFHHVSSYSTALSNVFNEVSTVPSELNSYNLSLRTFMPNSTPISVIILCKNEERCIRRCLSAITSQSTEMDEVIVIDTGSTDHSLSIIKEFSNIHLIQTCWQDDFSAIRNFGLSKAQNDWVFFVDSDETLDTNSLETLKKYLYITDWLNIQPLVIAPTIINHDDSISQGVRRVVKKSSNIHYIGLVHEELRTTDQKIDTELNYISFDNIILFHDGYQKEIIKQKDKTKKYVSALESMIKQEPNHPRWLYFFCRDGKTVLSADTYEINLLKVVNLCGDSESFTFYKIKALSNLVQFYFELHDLDSAKKYLQELKKVAPYLSDLAYFDVLIKYIKLKLNCSSILNDLIQFRQTRTELDYGSMHSNYYHLDYLIALLFFEIGEYDNAFSIYKKLEERNAGDFLSAYNSLYSILGKYMNDK